MSRVRGFAVLAFLFAAITYLVPHPAVVTPQGWRRTAIFACVIIGMIIEPLPASALVLLGLTAMVANGTPMREALGGFAEPSVWLVIAAMLIARSLLDSGLARRIALLFIRAFGHSSLGLAHAVQMTDVRLATGVTSITARSAGLVLPVALSIAEPMGSRPGPTPNRLGAFLIATMYQGSAVACAMFFTGQASNILGSLSASAGGSCWVFGRSVARLEESSRHLPQGVPNNLDEVWAVALASSKKSSINPATSPGRSSCGM